MQKIFRDYVIFTLTGISDASNEAFKMPPQGTQDEKTTPSRILQWPMKQEQKEI